MLYNFTFEEAMKVLYNEEGWVQGERFGNAGSRPDLYPDHPRGGGHQGDLLRHLQGSAPGRAARRHHHAGRRPDHAAH